MVLTREEAIENHRKLWNEIYNRCKNGERAEKEIGRLGADVQHLALIIVKEMSFYDLFTDMEVMNHDFCCEYAKEDCSLCPLKWDGCMEGKNGADGLYRKYLKSKSYEEAAKWAKAIRDLPEKEW